jgi:hypothetical protein
MAEIAELIAADYLHIMRWQMRLAELRPRRGDPAVLPALAAIWDTLASLIDLHMATDDEVCGPAIYGTGPHGLNLAREAADAHEDIREIIRETGLYPPGSPLWWTLATATLAAWTRCLHREVHGPLADRRRQASPALRARLARQWRTFMDARIPRPGLSPPCRAWPTLLSPVSPASARPAPGNSTRFLAWAVRDRPGWSPSRSA